MNYLLDTNVLIFLINKEFNKLSSKQKSIIFDSSNSLHISETSLFEIGIKARIGKTSFAHVDIEIIENGLLQNGIKLLKSKPIHYINIPKVPKVYTKEAKLHGDPFDLLIISQAILENLPVLSSDRLFPLYEGLNTIS